MRSDLGAVAGIADVETDLDELTVSFVAKGVDVEEILNEVADSNDKLKDWVLLD